jgi:ABC-2 type transport system permease protein
MIYKENFIIWSLVTVGWIFLNLIFYEVIYLNVSEIAGWNKSHLLVLLGFYFIFDFFLWGVLWQNMRELPEKINQGTLDLDLVKPINTQFLLSFRRIGLDDFHSLLFGIATIIYALKSGGLYPSLTDVILAISIIFTGFIYIYAAWFSSMCIAFWFDRLSNLHLVFPGFRQFWRIPQSFYKGIIRGVLTFIIPVTLVTTLPTQFLISKPEALHVFILGFFAFLSLLFSSWFLRQALKRYTSASS